MFNENLPHQQYKLVETPSQATVEELLPNKRTNKNQNHWSQQLSLLQAFRYYIYQLFWSQRWETFIFEVSTISWRAHTVISDYAKISAAPCPVQAGILLIHSIFQDSHTVSNLNSAQSNPLKLTTQRLNWQTNFLHQQNAPLPSLHMRFFNCLLLIKKSNSIEFLKKWQNLDKLLVFVCLFIFFLLWCKLISIPTRYQPIPLGIGNETPAVIQILQLYPNLICLN